MNNFNILQVEKEFAGIQAAGSRLPEQHIQGDTGNDRAAIQWPIRHSVYLRDERFMHRAHRHILHCHTVRQRGERGFKPVIQMLRRDVGRPWQSVIQLNHLLLRSRQLPQQSRNVLGIVDSQQCGGWRKKTLYPVGAQKGFQGVPQGSRIAIGKKGIAKGLPCLCIKQASMAELLERLAGQHTGPFIGIASGHMG